MIFKEINKALLKSIKDHTTIYAGIMLFLFVLEVYLDFSLILSMITLTLSLPIPFFIVSLYLLAPLSYIGAAFPLSLLLAVSILRLMYWYSKENKLNVVYGKLLMNNKIIYGLTGITAFAMFLMFLA